MKFFERRRMKKMVRHLLHEAHHASAMREDVAPAADIQAIHEAASRLRSAWKGGADAAEIDRAAEQVEERILAVYPPRNRPRLRENVEVFVVAISVAMAVRAYVVQPFKIPTGSMQPTLNGITVDPEAQKHWYDRFPLNLAGLVLFGESYREVHAKDSGQMQVVGVKEDTGEFLIRIGRQLHAVHRNMKLYFDPYNLPAVQKGQLLASGRRKVGDHIFVNRVAYNFARPDRGDVFVFSTRDIRHPAIRPDTFYIKRLVGLPGETISVDPPYLVANGQRVEEPYPFQRLVNDPGYEGYTLVSRRETPALLTRTNEVIQLGDDEYLPFGDNTRHSLDGRFFGGVPERDVVGPAFLVYWPLSSRWGLIR